MTPGMKALPDVSSPAVSRMKSYAEQHGPGPHKLVSLVRGEPDFPTPAHISQALWEAIEAGYTHYPPVNGYRELRQAVANRIEADYGLHIDPDSEILITSGATAGMYIALQAVIEAGDEVLLPDPIYDPYPNQVRVLGGVPVSVPAQDDGTHFTLTRAALEETVTPRTRALILNTPWNPTGSVLSESKLLDIGAFAVEHGLVIIVDEIYEKLVYDDHTHHPLVALSEAFRDHVITINSFSKTYAMTGWRLGYNLANSRLTQAMHLYYQHFSRGSAAFVQRAGIEALNGPQDCVAEMVAAYGERCQLMVDLIREIDGITCVAPQGGLFCLVDVKNTGYASEELAHYLVREWGLLTVPGSYYGPALEGYLRLSFSYSAEDIERGINILADGLRGMS